jgi:hypothetical protein
MEIFEMLFVRLRFFTILILFFSLISPANAEVSDRTEQKCRIYKTALHNMLERVNDLDRGSRFYTSINQMKKITKLLEKTVESHKKYEVEVVRFDSYLKTWSLFVKKEELYGLLEMRKDMRYGIGRRYVTKLKRYLRSFKRLLIFSKSNLKQIRKGNRSSQSLYDRYYLNYKKDYNVFKKTKKNYKKFIKRYYKKYTILNDVIPMPKRLFHESIWNLNKVKYFEN